MSDDSNLPRCETCGGSGWGYNADITCPDCNGTGHVPAAVPREPEAWVEQEAHCRVCGEPFGATIPDVRPSGDADVWWCGEPNTEGAHQFVEGVRREPDAAPLDAAFDELRGKYNYARERAKQTHENVDWIAADMAFDEMVRAVRDAERDDVRPRLDEALKWLDIAAQWLRSEANPSWAER